MRRVVVDRARDFKINSNSIHAYTYYVLDSSLYLGPTWDVKLERRLDVCAQSKRASKITLSHTHDKYTSIILL